MCAETIINEKRKQKVGVPSLGRVRRSAVYRWRRTVTRLYYITAIDISRRYFFPLFVLDLRSVR